MKMPVDILLMSFHLPAGCRTSRGRNRHWHRPADKLKPQYIERAINLSACFSYILQFTQYDIKASLCICQAAVTPPPLRGINANGIYLTSPSLSGSHIVISGTYVVISSVITIEAKNGRMWRITFVTVVSAIPQPKKRQVPIGGVLTPIH